MHYILLNTNILFKPLPVFQIALFWMRIPRRWWNALICATMTFPLPNRPLPR